MSGREPPRLADPDDWFADSGADAPVRHKSSGAADDWGEGEPAAARPEGFIAGFSVKLRTLLAVATIVVVLIVLAGLELGGVFSSSGKHPATTPTTASTTTTQTQTTTPTSPARPTRPVLAAPATTLKPGDQGAQVKLLQRALTRLGYSPGAADGAYGTSTEAAVKAFQQASKLAADGVVGPRTLQALKQALRTSG